MTLTVTWLAMQEHVLRKLCVLLVHLMSSFALTWPAGNTFREWIHSEEEVFAHLNWDKLLFKHQILNWTLGFDSTPSLMGWKYSFYCYSPFTVDALMQDPAYIVTRTIALNNSFQLLEEINRILKKRRILSPAAQLVQI